MEVRIVPESFEASFCNEEFLERFTSATAEAELCFNNKKSIKPIRRKLRNG